MYSTCVVYAILWKELLGPMHTGTAIWRYRYYKYSEPFIPAQDEQRVMKKKKTKQIKQKRNGAKLVIGKNSLSS